MAINLYETNLSFLNVACLERLLIDKSEEFIILNKTPRCIVSCRQANYYNYNKEEADNLNIEIGRIHYPTNQAVYFDENQIAIIFYLLEYTIDFVPSWIISSLLTLGLSVDTNSTFCGIKVQGKQIGRWTPIFSINNYSTQIFYIRLTVNKDNLISSGVIDEDVNLVGGINEINKNITLQQVIDSLKNNFPSKVGELITGNYNASELDEYVDLYNNTDWIERGVL